MGLFLKACLERIDVAIGFSNNNMDYGWTESIRTMLTSSMLMVFPLAQQTTNHNRRKL